MPFQPELKNEIQQLVETELFSHFKKLIAKFQVEGEIIEMPPSSVLRLTLSAVLGLLLTRFLLCLKKNGMMMWKLNIRFNLYCLDERHEFNR